MNKTDRSRPQRPLGLVSEANGWMTLNQTRVGHELKFRFQTLDLHRQPELVRIVNPAISE
jgi:hypothetical protein